MMVCTPTKRARADTGNSVTAGSRGEAQVWVQVYSYSLSEKSRPVFTMNIITKQVTRASMKHRRVYPVFHLV